MAGGGFRLASGGLIDRARPLRFRFEGREHVGFEGDTLASALLASGERVLGRSFKYHRPRGLLAAGVEEPNVLVQLERGAATRPNLRATEIALYDGLSARAVNCWPSARFDLGAVSNLFARFLPAGFYYKTFLWPASFWQHVYEPLIRRAAGLGRAPRAADTGRYGNRHAHCDLLVVGGGPAGLAAALAAARAGARVILAEQDRRLGGRLLWDPAEIDGLDGRAWAVEAEAALRAFPEVRVLPATTAIGSFDHDFLVLREELGAPSEPATRLWQVRARGVVLATGAIERPLVFAGNDRPGAMLSQAVRCYLGRYAAAPGLRTAIFTNNDDAYRTAEQLHAAGRAVAALVDTRADVPAGLAARMQALAIPHHPGAAIVATHGRPALAAVTLRGTDGRARRIRCDALAVSGGFNPDVHLFTQAGGRLAFDGARGMFVPAGPHGAVAAVGGAAGTLDLHAALAEAHRSGAAAAERVGFHAPSEPPRAAPAAPLSIAPVWRIDGEGQKAFVDFQNDVSAADITLAAQENFVSVEHLKRYTTLGMAADQGKTSSVNALAILGELTGRAPAEVGTTRHRYPFVATAFGTIAAGMRGDLLRPLRTLPLAGWHAAHGAKFEEYGGWTRPARYGRPGETAHDSEQRECLAVRRSVGIFDASPLGKIEVKGPDAATFLDRIYANRMSTLAIGRIRYGLMLSETGGIADDGVAARLGEDHFLVGTTSGNAARIAAAMEEWLQCEWRGLRVAIAPVTTAWGVVNIAGPQARALLLRLGAGFDAGAQAFPHMAVRSGEVAGIAARVLRVSFTGELSYEIAVPADRTRELWEAAMALGMDLGIAPVGLDAWMILRTEKGYLHLGSETDGETAPQDVGWGHVLAREDDFIGRRSLTRAHNLRADRLQLVGLERVGSTAALPVGAQLGGAGGGSQGILTSSAWSPTLGRGVALGMVRGGRARMGETLTVHALDGSLAAARVVDPCFLDREGARLNG
ncbi:MAG: sarcosine oxidase subunit alpha family protein [Sphingomonas sp.]